MVDRHLAQSGEHSRQGGFNHRRRVHTREVGHRDPALGRRVQGNGVYADTEFLHELQPGRSFEVDTPEGVQHMENHVGIGQERTKTLWIRPRAVDYSEITVAVRIENIAQTGTGVNVEDGDHVVLHPSIWKMPISIGALDA